MTHAHLPAEIVNRACSAAEQRLKSEREDIQKRYEVAHRNVTHATMKDITALNDEGVRIDARRQRVGLIGRLAWEVRDGTIAISIDDFALIESGYLAAKHKPKD
jgi:hypothetical protein